LQSADEKLRSLGGKHHGSSKTSVNVVSHSTSSLGRHPGRPPDSIPIQPAKSVSQEHLHSVPQHTVQQKSTGASNGPHQKASRSQPPREPPPDPPIRVQRPSALRQVELITAGDNEEIEGNNPDDTNMSERRIQRLGRRDLGAGKAQQQQKIQSFLVATVTLTFDFVTHSISLSRVFKLDFNVMIQTQINRK